MRNHIFSIDEYYHLYNRGVEKRITFDDLTDKKRFQYLLYICNTFENIEFRNFFLDKKEGDYTYPRKKKLVSIGAYVLMPNHFHILIKEVSPGGISKFMQKLQTAYTMYFNIKNKRSGALFQGRFKSQHVSNDVYLKYLYGYIHLNPLKLKSDTWKGDLTLLKNYEKILNINTFSSYLDYISVNKRQESSIIDPSDFPNYFESGISHKGFVDEWIKIKVDNIY